MPGGGGCPGDASAATLADTLPAHTLPAHTLPAHTLPAHLLAKIAAVVLARAESALLDETTRCQACRLHRRFRCVCLWGNRAGTWADINMEHLIGDCVHGSTVAIKPGESARAQLGQHQSEHVATYRQTLLGTVQRMRGVNKFWRDVISYDLMDNLRLDHTHASDDGTYRRPDIQYAADICWTAAAEALMISWPSDFSQRFAAVKILNLSRTCLETLPDGIRGMSELRCLVLEDVGMGALPHWMSELQLTELTISSGTIRETWWHDSASGRSKREPTVEEKQGSETLVRRRHALEAWLWSAETRLPITLERLTVKWVETDTTQLPPCIRYLTNLRSLSCVNIWKLIQYLVGSDLPGWLSGLTHLTSFQHTGQASQQSATVLGSMSLECLDIYAESYGNWVHQLPSLLAPNNAIRTSLRVLKFGGDCVMTELPLCLRHLQLTALDLDGSDKLNTLPEWLGDMPLEYLGLCMCMGVSRLPVSLRQVSTLRLIDTCFSSLGFSEFDEPAEQLEELVRMEAELLPLSASVQQLKFRIASDETYMDVGWCGGVWDPVLQPRLLEEIRQEVLVLVGDGH
jgi:hypothetical protein